MTHKIPKPGGFEFDTDDAHWWFRCPNCLESGPLDEHTVVVEYRVGVPAPLFTVEPEVVCGNCGAFYAVQENAIVSRGDDPRG